MTVWLKGRNWEGGGGDKKGRGLQDKTREKSGLTSLIL